MKTKKLLFYLLAALLGGCIPVMSLHPLFTEKNLVFEEKLLGAWVDDSNEATWEFKRPDKPEKETEKTYELILSIEGKKAGSFAANLLKLENSFFLDIFPNKGPCKEQDWEKVEWPYNAFFSVPLHTFIKIDSIGPQLKMRLTDDDEMEKLLKEDPNAVRYALADDKLILTASTKELQAFILKYADDNRVFTDEIVLSRKKTKDPNNPDDIDPNNNDPNET